MATRVVPCRPAASSARQCSCQHALHHLDQSPVVDGEQSEAAEGLPAKITVGQALVVRCLSLKTSDSVIQVCSPEALPVQVFSPAPRPSCVLLCAARCDAPDLNRALPLGSATHPAPRRPPRAKSQVIGSLREEGAKVAGEHGARNKKSKRGKT